MGWYFLSIEKLLKDCKDLFKSENYEDSISYCNQILDSDPKNETALDYKSMALFYLERYDESLDCLNMALKIYPNNGSMWNTKAGIMFNLEKYEDAIKCFDSSLGCGDLNKKDKIIILKNKSMCHLGLAIDLFYENYEFEKALYNLKIYLEYFPEDKGALGFKEEILTSIENKENPDICTEKRDERLIYLEEKAFKFYEDNLLKDSFDYYKLVLQASEDFRDHSWKTNFKWYDEVLSKCLNVFNGNYEEFFENLFEINEKTYCAWFDKAYLFSELHRRDISIDYCYKLLNFDSTNLTVLEFLGRMLYFSNRYDEALECYNKGLSIDKNYVKIIDEKLYLYLSLDRIDEAFEFYQTLDENIVIDDFYFRMLAHSLERNEMYNESIDCYEKMLKTHSNDLEVIDSIKRIVNSYQVDRVPNYNKELYESWIFKIKSKNNTELCPICGNKLIPIVYGYVVGDEAFERQEKGEIIIGGCVRDDSNSYFYCKNCNKKIDMGPCNLNIDCEKFTVIYDYISKNIHKITSLLWEDENIIVSKDDLRNRLNYLDENEFEKFIGQLLKINFIYEPKKGYLKLVD